MFLLLTEIRVIALTSLTIAFPVTLQDKRALIAFIFKQAYQNNVVFFFFFLMLTVFLVLSLAGFEGDALCSCGPGPFCRR